MNLKNTNTKWLFLCAIAHEKKNKSRHLKDISFGVFALLKNKIPVKNIEIIIDITIDDFFIFKNIVYY